jgi:hypothetical protein
MMMPKPPGENRYSIIDPVMVVGATAEISAFPPLMA